jgi:D-alanine-D-alanine ligase
MNTDKHISVGIMYTDPSPTEWEKKARVAGLTADRKNSASDADMEKARQAIRNEVELEIETVRLALENFGYAVTKICVSHDVAEIVRKLSCLRPDVVFNFCESSTGDSLQEMYIASVYELLGLKYTGSTPLILGLALHKDVVKRILMQAGVPTPEFWYVRPLQNVPVIPENLYPLIVKPNREDASIGIDNDSIVIDGEQLRIRVAYVHKTFEQPALIERFIAGREVNVSILGTKELKVLPISEIDFTGMPGHLHKIVSYEAKWSENSIAYGKTKPVCPAPIDESLAEKVRAIAVEAYKAVGIRHYGRVDMRIDNENNPYVLEVNPNPDISEDAGFVRSARIGGLPYDQLMNYILTLALN